jgi:hypothetical protein
MSDRERVLALERLERARSDYRRASLELDEAAAAIARWEGDETGGRHGRAELLAFWYARRADLLRRALDASERVVTIAAILFDAYEQGPACRHKGP